MTDFIAKHAAEILGFIVLGSLFFPVLNAALSKSWKESNPDAARIIDALSDLFLNGIKFVSKVLADKSKPSASVTPADEPTILNKKDPE